MIGIKNLLGMVLMDAIERGGEPENHHFDESLNKPYRPLLMSEHPDSNLHPFRFKYDLELIQEPDGSLHRVE